MKHSGPPLFAPVAFSGAMGVRCLLGLGTLGFGGVEGGELDSRSSQLAL